MIPVRASAQATRVPAITYAIVTANVVAFAWEAAHLHHLDALLFAHGLVPREFSFERLLSSMFLHGSWLHLLGNMLFLWVFGSAVEDRLGHWRYGVFYLLCGMFAGAAHALSAPHSAVPMVGASGAIAGVLGAYLRFFPRARVMTVIPLLFFVRIVDVPAVLYLAAWFLWQVASGVATLGAGETVSVAFWAHVGGFVGGALLGPALRPR